MAQVKADDLRDCFCGAVTVGERGQVVIPADARKRLAIQPGDKMLAMLHPTGNAVVLLKIEEVREMVSLLLDGLMKVEQESVVDSQHEVRQEE